MNFYGTHMLRLVEQHVNVCVCVCVFFEYLKCFCSRAVQEEAAEVEEAEETQE